MSISMSEVKKRSIGSANSKIMDTSENTPETSSKALVCNEAPKWQQDNKYILTGYRLINTSYSEVFKSLTLLHNETCNIYTHLIGALLLPLVAASFVQVLSEPRFFDVSGADYVALGIFFCGAECCLIFSAAFHLMECHSYSVEQFCLRMDLLGIIAVTVGTSVSGIYYIFACEPSLQKLHWIVVRYICGRTKANPLQSPYAKANDR
jgi:adiponectin receptor